MNGVTAEKVHDIRYIIGSRGDSEVKRGLCGGQRQFKVEKEAFHFLDFELSQ
jgi:hypothetical protein